MMLLNSFVIGLSIWQSRSLSASGSFWLLSFMAVATIATLFAPVMYCYLATEWSSLTIILAGFVQAFATLQLAVLVNCPIVKTVKTS